MKTNNLIYLLVIVLLSSIHCDVNAQYYWSQNRKNRFNPRLITPCVEYRSRFNPNSNAKFGL